MTLDLFEVSFLFVGFQSFLFASILFISNKAKKISSYVLGAFLLVLAMQSGLLLYARRLEEQEIPYAYLCIFGFLYGPLIWYYAKSLIFKTFRFRSIDALHFLPAAIMLVSALFGLNLCSSFGSLFYLTLILYSVLTVQRIVAYRKVIDQTQSTNENIKLNWLQWITIVFTLTFLLDVYEHFVGDIDVYRDLSLVNLLLLILVNSIFFQGLRQPMIFVGISEKDESLVITPDKSPLDGDVESDLSKIEHHMESEQPYLDPKLTLDQLSKQLDIPARRLSQLINRHHEKNFIDFVNSYRIELAKVMLKNPADPKQTVLEVMYEVGFNSKSSFNTVFKQKVGKTPSAYKQG